MNSTRQVVSTHRGSSHGPITRVINPSGNGEALKPFVFLDFIQADIPQGFGFGMHPHSGLATLTWQPDCDIQYEDSIGMNGVLKAGGLEWMNACGGAWHKGSFATGGFATGFQLWVPMPPIVENAQAIGQYVAPEDVPSLQIDAGRIQLLLGELTVDGHSLNSPINSHQEMNYFVLTLNAGQSWAYDVPSTHDVVFAFVFEGEAKVAGTPSKLEIAEIAGAGAVVFESMGSKTRVLIGSARKHDHDLVLGPSSIHTSEATLTEGLQRIREIGARLQREGRLGR